MLRLLTAVFVSVLAAPAMRGELPTIAPLQTEETTPVIRPIPGSPVPAGTVSTVPVAAPWTVNCLPPSACVDPCAPSCAKRPGVLRGLKDWLCGSAACDAGAATCPAPPARVVVAVPKPCPMPVRPTVECPTPEAKSKSVAARGGAVCEKIKAWFCWKPCNEQLLPILCPTPYHAPARAYLGECREPPAPLPCGTCKKVAKAKCETATCPQPVGPVVSAQAQTVIGWTPIYANYTPATSKVVQAVATVPAAKPQPVNPISRPFTSP